MTKKKTKKKTARRAPARRRNLGHVGSTAREHAIDAARWRASANTVYEGVMRTIVDDPCGAIEHLTDAAAEATVAEVQFEQAGDKDGAAYASRFVSNVVRRQREAVKMCVVERKRGS